MDCWHEVTIASENSPALELLMCGNDPSILFVHGSCCQASIWRPLMQAMRERGISTAALSLRGHGRSAGVDHLQEWRIEDYIEDVIRVIQQFDTPVTLVGHSMGGLVAQLVAVRTAVRGLVLMASYVSSTSGDAPRQFPSAQFSEALPESLNTPLAALFASAA